MRRELNSDNHKSVSPTSPQPRCRPFSQVLLLGGALVIVCVVVAAAHWPALSAGALSIDDNQYLTKNLLVQNPSWTSARRFLTEVLEPSTVDGYYQPLTMISLMLDYALGGRPDNLLAFHRTSLALHVANTALVIVLLYLLFGRAWVAAAAGLLFGLHPMTVDPITWVGERKTLLSAFFALWCLVLYVRFAHKSDWKLYVGCMATYLLAVMSKPVSLPLPAAMLLMDYWPLGRLKRRAILEKLPFFVVGVVFAIITYISQSRTCGAAPPSRYGPERIPLILCHNIIFYLYKIVWPANMSSFYPFPRPLGLSHPAVLVGVIGTCILILLLVVSLRWTRAVLTGWLFFFVAILPTMQIIGFTDVIASNKFAYLPAAGFLIILASFLGRLCYAGAASKAAVRRVVVTTAVVILAGAEAVATRRYLVHWRDTAGLYEYILTVAPDAIQVHNNLGNLLQSQGKVDEAITHYHQILRIEPNYFNAHYNLANALQSQGKLDEAASHYLRALQIRPKHFGAYQRRGILLRTQGKLDEAITHYRHALQVMPGFADAYYNLGIVLQTQGKLDEAIGHYRQALQLKPDFADAHYSIGNVLKSQGKLDEAISHYRYAVGVKADHFNAHYNLANTLQSQGKVDEAISHYRQALQAKPDFAKAHNSIGLALRKTGQLDGALKHFREAVRLKPNYLSPLKGLALILATHPDPKVRNANQAVELAERASELTKHQNAEVLGTLAEAYAAAGQFDRAVKAAQAGLALACAARNDKLANHIRKRLELYRQAQP